MRVKLEQMDMSGMDNRVAIEFDLFTVKLPGAGSICRAVPAFGYRSLVCV
nr:hypothetical protein [Thiocystis violacea]